MLGVTVAVLVAVCTLEGFDLWWRYKEALRAGEAKAQNLSHVLAEYLRGSFAVADTVLRQLAVHGRRIGGPDAPDAERGGILSASRAAMPVGRTGSISVRMRTASSGVDDGDNPRRVPAGAPHLPAPVQARPR